MVPSVPELSGALLLELQHAPECRHFALRRGELLVQVENLVLGGEQPVRHKGRCFRQIVVCKGGVCHEGTHEDCCSGYAAHNRIKGPLGLRDRYLRFEPGFTPAAQYGLCSTYHIRVYPMVTGNHLERRPLRNHALHHRRPVPDDPGFRAQ